jgi:hypothetical protein
MPCTGAVTEPHKARFSVRDAPHSTIQNNKYILGTHEQPVNRLFDKETNLCWEKHSRGVWHIYARNELIPKPGWF